VGVPEEEKIGKKDGAVFKQAYGMPEDVD